MAIIENQMVWGIIRRTLNCVDTRLVDHGERVAFVALELLRAQGITKGARARRLLLLCLLHDIGAYKTEEIDRMAAFETQAVWEHSVYGCLFLQRLSPLGKDAGAILYHHMDYEKLAAAGPWNETFEQADLIHLADRVDMIWSGGGDVREYLPARRGKIFSEKNTDLCLGALDRIQAGLASGEYRQVIQQAVCRLNFTESERSSFLEMLALSIDFRSEFMVLHTITTVSASMALAKRMEVPKKNRPSLFYGALLHDIGKVASPVEILEKPGKLTEEEFTIMKRHVEDSGRILEGFIDPVAYRIAVRHHEKLDGTGYPLGLVASDLTMEERICAVADILSALIRQRSYKSAFSAQQTKNALQNMAEQGKICPIAVAAVVAHYDEMMEEIDKKGARLLETYASIHQSYTGIMAEIEAGQFPSLNSHAPQTQGAMVIPAAAAG